MKTDPRTRVWMIEDCSKSKAPLKRKWAVCHGLGAFRTRKEAILFFPQDGVFGAYLYRTRQYMPVPKG